MFTLAEHSLHNLHSFFVSNHKIRCTHKLVNIDCSTVFVQCMVYTCMYKTSTPQ